MSERYTEEQRRVRDVFISAVKRRGCSEISLDDFMAELAARKLRDDCPVLYTDNLGDTAINWSENLERAIHITATNVRALIPVDEAREIARRAITRHCVTSTARDDAMAEVGRDLDAYQYGEEA